MVNRNIIFDERTQKHADWQETTAMMQSKQKVVGVTKLTLSFAISSSYRAVCHEQRSMGGQRVDESREKERRQSLGQERAPRSPKRSNFTKRPTWRGNHHRGRGHIRQTHTFTGAPCTTLNNNVCVWGETVARRNSCLEEKAWRRNVEHMDVNYQHREIELVSELLT